MLLIRSQRLLTQTPVPSLSSLWEGFTTVVQREFPNEDTIDLYLSSALVANAGCALYLSSFYKARKASW